MSTGRPPPGTIPTLTEVVAWPDAVQAVEEPAPVQSAPVAPVTPAPAPTPVAAAPEPVHAVEPIAPVAPPAPVQPAVSGPGPAAPATAAAVPATTTRPTTASPADVQLTQRVLADLQRQVELMLEVRLREALAPILARASDALVRDARKELTAAMRDIVSRSIARELGKREDR